MKLTKDFCTELKYARIKNGIKSNEVADRLGKSPAWLCKLEKGQIKSIDDKDYQFLLDLYEINNDYIQTEIYRLTERINQLEAENKDLRQLLRWYMPTK